MNTRSKHHTSRTRKQHVRQSEASELKGLHTLLAFTVRNVLDSTTIGPGEQETAAAVNRTRVRVSVAARVLLMRLLAVSIHPECECHGHAHRCHFSQRVWISTGGTSGGVCDNCKHNTTGRKCHRCRPGYRRHLGRQLHPHQACTKCRCNSVGSMPVSYNDETIWWCQPRTGQCLCKTGVGGTSCSHCLPGYWGFGFEGCSPCICTLSCDPVTGYCLESKANREFYNIPIGGQIPDLTHFHPHEENKSWSNKLTVSAQYYTGKCSCKERKVKSVSDLCRMKHAYVMKASVLSAHDEGTHAVVQVKVRKVLRSGIVALSQGTHSLYPLSWTSRGCTCPVLNPGVEYLLAGSEKAESGRLLVTMQSLVVPWTNTLDFLVSDALRQGCF